MEEIKKGLKREASKRSARLRRSMKAGGGKRMKPRKCAAEGCDELVTKISGYCKLHLKRCIMSFDFNNLYVGYHHHLFHFYFLFFFIFFFLISHSVLLTFVSG